MGQCGILKVHVAGNVAKELMSCSDECGKSWVSIYHRRGSDVICCARLRRHQLVGAFSSEIQWISSFIVLAVLERCLSVAEIGEESEKIGKPEECSIGRRRIIQIILPPLCSECSVLSHDRSYPRGVLWVRLSGASSSSIILASEVVAVAL